VKTEIMHVINVATPAWIATQGRLLCFDIFGACITCKLFSACRVWTQLLLCDFK